MRITCRFGWLGIAFFAAAVMLAGQARAAKQTPVKRVERMVKKTLKQRGGFAALEKGHIEGGVILVGQEFKRPETDPHAYVKRREVYAVMLDDVAARGGLRVIKFQQRQHEKTKARTYGEIPLEFVKEIVQDANEPARLHVKGRKGYEMGVPLHDLMDAGSRNARVALDVLMDSRGTLGRLLGDSEARVPRTAVKKSLSSAVIHLLTSIENVNKLE